METPQQPVMKAISEYILQDWKTQSYDSVVAQQSRSLPVPPHQRKNIMAYAYQ